MPLEYFVFPLPSQVFLHKVASELQDVRLSTKIFSLDNVSILAKSGNEAHILRSVYNVVHLHGLQCFHQMLHSSAFFFLLSTHPSTSNRSDSSFLYRVLPVISSLYYASVEPLQWLSIWSLLSSSHSRFCAFFPLLTTPWISSSVLHASTSQAVAWHLTNRYLNRTEKKFW